MHYILRRLAPIGMIAFYLNLGDRLDAQDSLLGLPKPIDEKAPGALMLHGGGRVTDEAFDRFVEIVGDGNTHVFLKANGGRSIVWHELHPGESATLERTAKESRGLSLEQNSLTQIR